MGHLEPKLRLKQFPYYKVSVKSNKNSVGFFTYVEIELTKHYAPSQHDANFSILYAFMLLTTQ